MPKPLFEIFATMAERNMDIRRSDIMVSVQQVKQGGHLAFGIDHKTTQELMHDPSRFRMVAFVVDSEQYKQIENE